MRQSDPCQHAELVTCIVDLIDIVNSIVDFGLTVCAIGEERMAGYWQFLYQRHDETRRLIQRMTSCLQQHQTPDRRMVEHYQGQLRDAGNLFLDAFESFMRYRDLESDSLRAVVDSFRLGWERIHEVLAEIAEAFHCNDPATQTAMEHNKDYCLRILANLYEVFAPDVEAPKTR